MEIKGVSNNSFFVNSPKSKKGEPAATVQKDKIEISTEAREKVVGGDLDQDRVNELREKVSSGFYNSEAVLNKVAEKLIVDLKL